ncbi:TolC family protein [Agriterribacter sp.]|uniref:TolC family protein n=1 Tax=Agriterribacter sp. TaxID=2821509 RepID=UPI002D00B7F5|nr:TolC family protein [Agriterribacter sp.]HTN05603.1 TolC family protein [Agriterribacter sp.]
MKIKEWKLAAWGLIMLVAVCSASVQAQQAQSPQVHAFSIQQAIDYAKQNNVQVKNALLDIKIQEQTNREFTGAAYPQIHGTIGTSYNPNVATQVIPNFIGPAAYQVLVNEGVKDGNGNPIKMPSDFGFIAAQFGTKFSATAGVSLSQILFDGQVFVGLQARRTLIQFQEKGAELTEETIRANVYKIYYQLVVSKTQIELLDANIELLNKLQHDTRIMHENGFAEKLDLDKLSVQLANLQTEKESALNQIQNGYLGLKVLMGMPVKDSLVLTDSLTDEKIKNGILLLNDFDYSQRKDYQYAELGIKLKEYDIRRYRLSKLPTLNLNGYYNKSAQRNKFDFLGDGSWFNISAVSLQLNIPIFTGFSANARIAKAKLSLQQSLNQREALKINIDNEVETARNNFNTAVATLDYQKKNMQLAETVFQQTKKKFEIGTGSNTEITQAQTDMKAAQTNYINALYNAIIARIDYIKATGRL